MGRTLHHLSIVQRFPFHWDHCSLTWIQREELQANGLHLSAWSFSCEQSSCSQLSRALLRDKMYLFT